MLGSLAFWVTTNTCTVWPVLGWFLPTPLVMDGYYRPALRNSCTCFQLKAAVKGTNPDVRLTRTLTYQHQLQLLNFTKPIFLTGKMELIFVSTSFFCVWAPWGIKTQGSAGYLIGAQEIHTFYSHFSCLQSLSFLFFHFKSWKKIENGSEHILKWHRTIWKSGRHLYLKSALHKHLWEPTTLYGLQVFRGSKGAPAGTWSCQTPSSSKDGLF